MNFHGMAGAVRLMTAHASAMNISYDVAVRMRLDLGAAQIGGSRTLSAGAKLSAASWAVVHERAARQSGLQRTLHGCSAFIPGVRGGDNCFWGAAQVLADVVLHVSTHWNGYMPMPIDGGKIQPVINVSSCTERLFQTFPEAVLLCAMKDTSVIGCAQNCTRCSSSEAPCRTGAHFCTRSGSCQVGCCLRQTH